MPKNLVTGSLCFNTYVKYYIITFGSNGCDESTYIQPCQLSIGLQIENFVELADRKKHQLIKFALNELFCAK